MQENTATIPEDMRKAIEDCDARCDAIFLNFGKAMDAVPPPEKVFHYTDSAGLLGILESGTIRMTDIFSQNDPSELRHGITHACEVLATEAKGAHPAAAKFADHFREVIKGNIDTSAHFFIACFSKDGNELGQWRAYGDDGKGFSLGFDGKSLDAICLHITNEQNPANATFPITYDDETLQNTQRQIVREFLPLFELPAGKGLSEPIINEYFKAIYIALSICAIRMSSFFKHEAYKNEQEYRFLCLRGINRPMDDVHYWARRYSLVRFIRLDWKTPDPTILREIVIGPAADESAAREFINDSLLASGLEPSKIAISKSSIPYRS